MTDKTLYEYSKFLPGIDSRCSEEFFRIAQIFTENVFELITINDGDMTKYGIVYMMDDAIESFIILDNAVITGEYSPKMRAKITGSLEIQKDTYILVVHQQDEFEKDNFFTIRFSDLHMENHMYTYHNIGHFWYSGYEYLRQLDYRLWIIRDKYQFWKEKACNEKEIKLLPLYEFAPLRYYTCIDWEKDAGNPYSEDGIDSFLELAEIAGDKIMIKLLKGFKKRQNMLQYYLLVFMLRSKRHQKVVELLREKIDEASMTYQDRHFSEELDSFIDGCRDTLHKILKSLGQAELLEEQPFTIYEKFSYSFHILIPRPGLIFMKKKIITIRLDGDDLQELTRQFDSQLAQLPA